MRKQVLSFLLILISFMAYGQRIRCAVDINFEQNHGYYEKLNEEVQAIISAKSLRRSAQNGVIRIPVVVHVIHNNTAGIIGGLNNTNISDDRIYSQIQVLNEDFRRKQGTAGYNDNPVGADMEIEFFLANIDPDGRPSTGINRVYSSRRSFSVYTDLSLLSSLSYWDSNKYLNIWVANLSGGILGYSSMPAINFPGLDTDDDDEFTDGVFISYEVMGKNPDEDIYSEGRTTTHEIGHWLGLLHTWGDTRCGTDYCEDTPTIEFPNLTDSCGTVFSNCRGISTRNMIENFLDYSPDKCMNIFTSDQKNRTRAILELSPRRMKLIQNAVLFEPISEPVLVKVLGNPVEGNQLDFFVFVNHPKNFEISLVDNLGRLIYYKKYENSMSRAIQIPKNQLGKGLMNLRVKTDEEVVYNRIGVM